MLATTINEKEAMRLEKTKEVYIWVLEEEKEERNDVIIL